MKVNRNYPKVKLNRIPLSDNYYTCDGNRWNIPRLIQYCKEHHLKQFELPLAAIDLDTLPWNIISFKDIAKHANRSLHSNIHYPIILDSNGYICDGWHRVLKALILGQTTIKAVRIQQMPEPDGKECIEKE